MITARRLFLCLSLGFSHTPALLAAPPETWPYWPKYKQTPLAEISPQKWIATDHTINGWDWSLPPSVKPAPNGLLAANRTSRLDQPLGKQVRSVDLPVNQTIELWIKWRDLEPEEGRYRFDLLRDRIAEAEKQGSSLVLRILTTATTFAPAWMEAYGVPLRKETGKNKPNVTNYEISHPEFHRRYLRLVDQLGQSGIPGSSVLKGAYVGYASPSYGDEGIGPEGTDPDSVPHVIERLEAWARAFKGVEHKVYMGGISRHGLQQGFGIRRGFVEMYLYHIPDKEIGQMVDDQGYLYVDDSVEVLRRRLFHGEENEEYEEAWATAERGFRFGESTDSFTYRYFTSNLRTVQMQCTHLLHNPFSIYPEQMVWVGQSLGRTVEDSPEVWCALRESYVRRVGPVKNLEHWLYQRDSVGFETTPSEKISHPIKMWMVEPGQHFDFIARKGKQIGLAVDDRWCGGGPVNIALKATYFDRGHGAVEVALKTSKGEVVKKIQLTGDGGLKTATFFVDEAVFPARNMDHDVIFRTTEDDAVLSFVRIILKTAIETADFAD